MIDVVDIIFRILNFAVIAGLVVYAFRIYAIPLVADGISKHQVFLLSLVNKQHECQSKIEQVVQEAKKQDKSYKSIEEKFKIWQKVIHQNELDVTSQCQLMQQDLEKKMEKRVVFLKNMAARKKEVPRILSEVRQELRDQYQSDQEKKKYNDALVSFLKKR